MVIQSYSYLSNCGLTMSTTILFCGSTANPVFSYNCYKIKVDWLFKIRIVYKHAQQLMHVFVVDICGSSSDQILDHANVC